MSEKLSFNAWVKQAAATAQMPEDKTRLAMNAALGMVHKHAAEGPRGALYAAISGCKAAAQDKGSRPKAKKGLLSGMLGSLGGQRGAAMADGMGLLDRMAKLGITRSSLRRLLPAARNVVVAETGRDLFGDALTTIPGSANAFKKI